METSKQRKKIIEIFKDGQWHCINEVRANYIFSFHKRRVEIEGRKNLSELPTGMYLFEEKKCEHGVRNQKDFRIFINRRLYKEVQYFVPDLGKSVLKLEKINA